VSDTAAARARGICPCCKDGNGRVFDAGSSRVDCYGCRGKGTWDAYRLHREFLKGWNAAVEDMQRAVGWRRKDMP
jgi:hypothetical protein